MAAAALVLTQLATKQAIDDVIHNTLNKVVILRFGKAQDAVCMQLDELLLKTEKALSKMAQICLVEAEVVPIYCQYFDISLIPATIFFFNGRHIKVDYGTPDHTKFIGAFRIAQDLIDLVEVIYRGAKRGKSIVACPFDKSRILQYELLYKDF